MLFFRLFALIYCIFLPGWLLARTFLDSKDLTARLALGTVLGLGLVPLSSFSLAMILGSNISEMLLLTVATVVNLPLAARWIWLRRAGCKKSRRASANHAASQAMKQR